MVFWVTTPCKLEGGHKDFRERAFMHDESEYKISSETIITHVSDYNVP
jgi:hypothetical protein